MKLFWKIFFRSMPVGLGFALVLLSVAFAAKVVDGYRSEDHVFNSIVCGIIGFPLVIAGPVRLMTLFAPKVNPEKDS